MKETQLPGQSPVGILLVVLATDSIRVVWDSVGLSSVMVEVYDTFGCLIASLNQSVDVYDIPTGYYNDADMHLRIFPNPFNKFTTITFYTDGGRYEFLVFDMLGNRVRRIENILSDRVVLEKGDLTSGIYFIEIKSETQTLKGKGLNRVASYLKHSTSFLQSSAIWFESSPAWGTKPDKSFLFGFFIFIHLLLFHLYNSSHNTIYHHDNIFCVTHLFFHLYNFLYRHVHKKQFYSMVSYHV